MSRGVRGKPPTQRQRRVSEEIRQALAWIFERGDLRDPVLARMSVTVTEVRTSPDLRNATAFVTPLGGGDAGPLLDALRRAKPFLRHELAAKVDLKYVPNLTFEADTSFDAYQRIDRLLHDPKVRRDTHPEEVDGETDPSADGRSGEDENGA